MCVCVCTPYCCVPSPFSRYMGFRYQLTFNTIFLDKKTTTSLSKRNAIIVIIIVIILPAEDGEG